MLELFARINDFNKKLDKPQLNEVSKIQPAVLEVDSRTITTDYDRSVIDAVITVHKLVDYRRQFSSMMLMPTQSIELDKLLFDREELEGEQVML